ncbi:mitochondrial carrier [Piedraia hortae CBS 480.64]|uniref:Mitochondrial carrier n=1 Tax=Piedraia hortae CBS 480.64 TaxID=1314780 RepID=A0A6A7C2S0_9PEZI|nr:mitochondrial carrier [Piedraia hortae CBS 480.64]
MNIVIPPPSIGGPADGSLKKPHDTATTGLGASAMRAFSARMLAFYFRAPMKAFFRARVDYMGYPRAISPLVQKGEKWSWRMSGPALLYSAIQRHGWTFIPNQVLPPLLANTVVGAVLYTSYLQVLGYLHEPAQKSTKRIDPLPSPSTTFTAGFAAGAIQSLVAAPVDALQVRFQARELMSGKYKNMWHYAYRKTQEIGIRGIFAGWSLALIRDAFGNAAFFSTFEYVKGQAFYTFISHYYGHYGNLPQHQKDAIKAQGQQSGTPEIRPHYLLEPAFLALAGIAASVVQAVIQHPVSRIQDIHYGRLAWIDSHMHTNRSQALSLYADAYRKTLKQCIAISRRSGGLMRWLYKDFLVRTVTQVPSTSAGLIAFEVIRRMYNNGNDAVRINKDGYQILLF